MMMAFSPDFALFSRPDVHFHCDLDYDPFLFMQDHNKTYCELGFLTIVTLSLMPRPAQRSPSPCTSTARRFRPSGTRSRSSPRRTRSTSRRTTRCDTCQTTMEIRTISVTVRMPVLTVAIRSLTRYSSSSLEQFRDRGHGLLAR